MCKSGKHLLYTIVSAALVFALLAVPQILEKETLLFGGAQSYAFYTHSNSSNAKITLAGAAEAANVKISLGGVTGESARYENAELAFAQVQKYGGVLRFEESAAGVTNFYYYSKQLGGGVALGGTVVNLHVAVREESACVGFPIIFGGY